MQKIFQSALLPIVILTSGILLSSCDQSPQSSMANDEQADSQNGRSSESTRSSNTATDNEAIPEQHRASTQTEFKSGNMFYIARDVANVQLKTGDYVEKLQDTQSELQHAIDTKDQQRLQDTAQDLSRELRSFNTALISLELNSQEIDSIRQQVIRANTQMLKSSFLNGDVDISKVDLKKIEKQLNNIQMDMLKLVSMVIPQNQNSSDQNEQN